MAVEAQGSDQSLLAPRDARILGETARKWLPLNMLSVGGEEIASAPDHSSGLGPKRGLEVGFA